MKAYRSSPVCSWPLLLSLLCLWMSVQSSEDPSLPLRAVNLGGWLVTEGWITPYLFKDIINSDTLDGTKVQFKSTKWEKYLCADKNLDKDAPPVVANRDSASDWETFRLWRVTEDRFHFRAFNGQFVGLDASGSSLVANAQTSDNSETFQIIRKPGDAQNRVHIKAISNGMYLQAKSENLVTADVIEEPGWEVSEAVFVMNLVGGLQGEYQLTNGLGPERATQVMQEHWNTFIVEEDFEFIANSGLNAVRIPVGWWTAETTTPAPFVEGSSHVLENAFGWAKNHNLKVILDLHAPYDSQNGEFHSGTRDGTIEFGSQESIDRAVKTIENFMERYAKFDSLFAVELINEPHAPEVSLDAITQYYKAGYDAVRKYSSTAYVIMSDRLGKDAPATELLDLANGRYRTVIDVHYYNLYTDNFKTMTVQQHINFVYNTRASQLSAITPANAAEPLSFVGEWVAEWTVPNAAKEDYQRFAKAQLEVYGRASFGWAYWTLKNVNQHWSLRWMIENGYITL